MSQTFSATIPLQSPRPATPPKHCSPPKTNLPQYQCKATWAVTRVLNSEEAHATAEAL